MPDLEAVMMTFYNESDEAIASKSLWQAQKIIENVNQKGGHFEENEFREALKLYLTAFWGLPQLRASLSHNMHQIGKSLRAANFCEFKFDHQEEKYFTTCPCILLHCDYGFSLRGTEKYKCSICGKQTIECEHITGHSYDKVECTKSDGACNICGKKECEHTEGNRYNHVLAYEIAYDVEVITFDVVHTPKMAFARTTKIYYQKEKICNLSNQIPNFIYGMPLNCDHCISCKGYDKNQMGLL